jgi:hypothetical protein
MLINKLQIQKISKGNFFLKKDIKYSILKFFCEKNSNILYVEPKYYANINNTIPSEIYSEKYKLTFG